MRRLLLASGTTIVTAVAAVCGASACAAFGASEEELPPSVADGGGDGPTTADGSQENDGGDPALCADGYRVCDDFDRESPDVAPWEKEVEGEGASVNTKSVTERGRVFVASIEAFEDAEVKARIIRPVGAVTELRVDMLIDIEGSPSDTTELLELDCDSSHRQFQIRIKDGGVSVKLEPNGADSESATLLSSLDGDWHTYVVRQVDNTVTVEVDGMSKGTLPLDLSQPASQCDLKLGLDPPSEAPTITVEYDNLRIR